MQVQNFIPALFVVSVWSYVFQPRVFLHLTHRVHESERWPAEAIWVWLQASFLQTSTWVSSLLLAILIYYLLPLQNGTVTQWAIAILFWAFFYEMGKIRDMSLVTHRSIAALVRDNYFPFRLFELTRAGSIFTALLIGILVEKLFGLGLALATAPLAVLSVLRLQIPFLISSGALRPLCKQTQSDLLGVNGDGAKSIVRIFILDTPDCKNLNAFAHYPSQAVVVTRPLLDALPYSEVTAVLMHEMNHLLEGRLYWLRLLPSLAFLEVVLCAIAWGGAGDAPSLLLILLFIAIISKISTRYITRHFEKRADAIENISLTSRHALASALIRIYKAGLVPISSPFASTHPDLRSRIVEIAPSLADTVPRSDRSWDTSFIQQFMCWILAMSPGIVAALVLLQSGKAPRWQMAIFPAINVVLAFGVSRSLEFFEGRLVYLRCAPTWLRTLRQFPVSLGIGLILAAVAEGRFNTSARGAAMLILLNFALVASVLDAIYWVIPHPLTIAGIALGFGFAHWSGTGLGAAMEGLLLGAGGLLAINEFCKHTMGKPVMGGGDIMLVGMIASFTGPDDLVTIILGAWVNSTVYITTRWLRKAGGRRDVPMAPFLGLGILGAILLL